MRARSHRGFTLIELLCSLCIILVLVSLMVGPIFKAFKRVKQFEGGQTAVALVERFEEAMRKHFGSAENYPERTAEQLYAAGVIDSNLREFFRRKEVKFIPFSSQTPETSPILMIETSPGEVTTVLKADIRPRD